MRVTSNIPVPIPVPPATVTIHELPVEDALVLIKLAGRCTSGNLASFYHAMKDELILRGLYRDDMILLDGAGKAIPTLFITHTSGKP